MSSQVIAIAFDCRHPEPLATFWKAALGYRTVERWTDSHGTGYVELKAPGLPSLLFQPVPETGPVKNPVHLDLAPSAIEQHEEVERLVGLGARVLADPPDDPWIVLADPEDNEFCVLPRR